MIYTVLLSLLLAEYDLQGPIGSQSKVFCRSALLCRFNIPVRILLIIMHTIEYAMSYDRKQDGCVDKKQYNFSTKHAFVYIVSYCILSIILIIASVATVVRHLAYS